MWRRVLLWSGALLVGLGGPLAAQAPLDSRADWPTVRDGSGPWGNDRPGTVGKPPVVSDTAQWREAGVEAGREVSVRDWIGRGFLGGILLGPVGTVIAVHRSGASEPSSPEAVLTGSPAPSQDEARRFQEGFVEEVRSRRQTAATLGGIAGTGVFLYVLLRQFTGGDDGGPGLIPPDNGGDMNTLPGRSHP